MTTSSFSTQASKRLSLFPGRYVPNRNRKKGDLPFFGSDHLEFVLSSAGDITSEAANLADEQSSNTV